MRAFNKTGTETGVGPLSADNPYRDISFFILISGIIIVILGAIGNTLVVATLVTSRKLRRDHSSKFIINLAISDLIFSLIVIPASLFVRFAYGIFKNYDLSNSICELEEMTFFWTFFVSLISMSLISINRLVLIVFHSKYQRIYTKLNVSLMIAFAWLVGLGLALLPYFRLWGEFLLDPVKRNWCSLRPLNGSTPRPLFFFVGFSVPAVAMIVTYALIWFKVVNHSNILKTDRAAARNFKLFKLIVIIFSAFILCYFPNLLIKAILDKRGWGYTKAIGNVLVWCNSCVNPIIYFSFNRDYRIALETMIGFRFCGSTPDQPTPSVDTAESAISSNGGRINVPMSSTATSA